MASKHATGSPGRNVLSQSGKPDRAAQGSLDILLLTSTLVLGLLLVPDLKVTLLWEPAFWAVIGAVVVFTRLLLWRVRGRQGSRAELWTLAGFLALMPTVYLLSLIGSEAGSRWLLIEIGGQVVFAALAVAAVRIHPLLLGLGIMAHGLLWDGWHHGRAGFIPDWYTTACLIVDLGWGAYALMQPYRRPPKTPR